MAQQSEICRESELNERLTDQKTDLTDWRPSSETDNGDLSLSSVGIPSLSCGQDSDTDLSRNRSLSFAMTGNSNVLAPVPLLNGRLPNSDAEFAAIMGILGDADLDSLKEVRILRIIFKQNLFSNVKSVMPLMVIRSSDMLYVVFIYFGLNF